MTEKTHSTATALSKKAIYLSHFTPSMMAPETLETMLVKREPVLARCMDNVTESLRTGSSHHTLFVGPRGIGKTHLISLLHHRLSKVEAVNEKALIAWMREEEWGVTSFFELILRILRTLDNAYPSLNVEELTAPIYKLSIKEAERSAEALILKVLGDKRLVILLENLDDLFDQLGDQGQKAWRAFIQNHNNMVLVCTTPALFTGVSSQRSAFYGFFDIEPLVQLEFEDVVALLGKIAIERGDRELASFIETPEGRSRIRAVHHLAEGNPRIYIIFAQFLNREALDDLVQAFMHTLDELTPYYQARMKELPGQQRKVVEYLVNYRGAAPVKQIAEACFITQQTCSSQLKVLKEKRYVRSIEQGRQSYYELCEPLMRLCMEVKKQHGEPVSLFVEMLRIWYTEDQLKALLDDSAQSYSFEAVYLKKALELLETEKLEPKVQAVMKDLMTGSDPLTKQPLLREFIELSTKNAQIQQFQSMARLVLFEMYPIANFSDQQIHRYALDVTTLATSLSAIIKKEKDAYNVLLPLVYASANLFAYSSTYCQPIFEVLISFISRFPASGAVAIIRAMIIGNNPAPSWLEALLKAHPKGIMSREIGTLTKRLRRVSTAINESLISNNQGVLLQLPREERSLVEGIVKHYIDRKNTNRTNHS